MTRPQRYCPAGLPQHIVQRGHNRMLCFYDDVDRRQFLQLLRIYADKFAVQVHAYVLMSNHVHILATPTKEQALTKMMQGVGVTFVMRFNKRHGRSGTLWEGRFRSSPVDNPRYLLLCYRYIELNPLRANMVSSPEQYLWSSYHTNALGKDSALITPHALYLQLAPDRTCRLANYRALFPDNYQLSDEQLDLLRSALNTGRPISKLIA